MMENNDESKKLEILLIEDNEDDAERIEKSLDPNRYHITNVWNGKKALDFLVKRDNDIDVVLLDKGLPYKSGLELLKETRDKGKEYAFIFLTIDNTVETVVEAMKLGTLDFLPKSAGFDSLPEMIEKVHEIHQNKLDRKKAEEAFKKSEEKFRLITENTNDVITLQTLDINSFYTYASPSVKALSGYEPEEILGKSCFEFIHPEDKKELIPLLKKYIGYKMKKLITRKESDYSETIEFRIKDKSGKWIYVQSTGSIMEDQFLFITRDITERKQAQEILLESEKRYRGLYSMMRLMCDNLPDLIWTKDAEGKYLFVNKACSEILLDAKDTDEPIGKTDKYFAQRGIDSHPENPDYFTFGEACTNSDLAVLDNKKPMRFDESGNVKGKFLFLDVYKAPFEDENGEIIGIVGCARVVTKERQIEKKLRESEQQFRDMANLLPQIVYEIDVNGNLIFVNKQAFVSFGYSEKEYATGFNIMQALITQDRDRAKENMQNILYGKEIGNPEYTALKKDGSTFPVLIYSSAIIKDNKPVGLRGIIVDITERKKAEEELKKHREHLEELVKERTIELEEKNNELEQFNKLFINREFRIKELRDIVREREKQIEELKKQ